VHFQGRIVREYIPDLVVEHSIAVDVKAASRLLLDNHHKLASWKSAN
jgi:hypothetical protein